MLKNKRIILSLSLNCDGIYPEYSLNVWNVLSCRDGFLENTRNVSIILEMVKFCIMCHIVGEMLFPNTGDTELLIDN